MYLLKLVKRLLHRRATFDAPSQPSSHVQASDGVAESSKSAAYIEEVQDLERMLDGIRRGIGGVGLETRFLLKQVSLITDTLKEGDAAAIAYLYWDVAGESLSLGSGKSPYGASAMVAIGDAIGGYLVRLRSLQAPLVAGAPAWIESNTLLERLREGLLHWVSVGQTLPSPGIQGQQDDLTLIAEFLDCPAARKGAISAFLAANEVMRAGLALFHTQPESVDAPNNSENRSVASDLHLMST